MRVFIFGDANVDITVNWKDAKAHLGRLSKKNRALLLKTVSDAFESNIDIEHYLPVRSAEFSKFFNSLKPRVELGGCGAIKALTMAKLGHDVVFYSWVGDDKSGGMLLNELSKAGVDVSNVKLIGKTCETYNLFSKNKPRVAFSFWENKSSLAKFIKDVAKSRPDAVLLTGAHRLKTGLGYAKLPGAYIFTGSFATYSRAQLDKKYIADFSNGILVGNDSEMMQLTNTSDPISAMAMLPISIVVMHAREITAVKRVCAILVAKTAKADRSKAKELTGLGDVWEATFINSVGDLETASENKIMSSMRDASRAAAKRMMGKRS